MAQRTVKQNLAALKRGSMPPKQPSKLAGVPRGASPSVRASMAALQSPGLPPLPGGGVPPPPSGMSTGFSTPALKSWATPKQAKAIKVKVKKMMPGKIK